MSPDLYGRNTRTSFTVSHTDIGWVENITGGRRCWKFRLHFHMGEEIAHILSGRVRLRLPQHTRIFEAGETAVVPGGMVHRFEAVDNEGWAFSSNFISGSRSPDLRAFLTSRLNGGFVEYVCNSLFSRETLHTDVDAIARNCSLSAGYLSRAFHRATGTGIHNYHVLMALEKSKNLLREQRSIVSAANEAGFCDQAHLTRELVRTLGMTPIFREAWA